MKLVFFVVLGLVSGHSKASVYKSCPEESSIVCDKNEVEQAYEKISDNLKGTKEVLFKEILKQRVLRYLDQHFSKVKNLQDCLSKEIHSISCDDEVAVIKDTNTKMRMYLGLRDSKQLVDHYKNRPEDKVNKKISHFRSISKTKLEPLSDEEVVNACIEFDKIRDAYFKAHNISEDMKGKFPAFFQYEKAVQAIKDMNLEMFQSKYKTLLKERPYLKYLKSAQPDKAELIASLKNYEDDILRKKRTIEQMKYSKMDDLIANKTLVEAVLKDNPLFCDVAINARDNIDQSYKFKDPFLNVLISEFINQ